MRVQVVDVPCGEEVRARDRSTFQSAGNEWGCERVQNEWGKEEIRVIMIEIGLV